MPMIDMPLEELRTYKGVNECPSDLDAFWDEGIAEMEALGTACELIPSAFQVPGAECFDLWFTGVGGSRIHSVLLRPAVCSQPLPAVVHFHGYSGNCGDFSDHLRWVAAGFCTAAMDCRGQGGQSEDLAQVCGNTLEGHIIRGLDESDPRKLYYRNVFLDTAQLARIVMALPFVNEKRVGAYGLSQGGGLTLACAALTPTLCQAAPHMPFLSDYRRVWDMDLSVNAYKELRDYFRRFDPRHLRETEIFTRLGYVDVHHMAHRIRAKIRMYTGLMDTVCPPSTQFAAYNCIEAPKECLIYPDYAHEAYPGQPDDVMQWMLEM
ncbi:MAG: acetylxylan esterase [Clostridia bacterium]